MSVWHHRFCGTTHTIGTSRTPACGFSAHSACWVGSDPPSPRFAKHSATAKRPRTATPVPFATFPQSRVSRWVKWKLWFPVKVFRQTKHTSYEGANITVTHTYTQLTETNIQKTVKKQRGQRQLIKKKRDSYFIACTTSSNFVQLTSTVSTYEFAFEETEELPREAVLLPSQCYFPSLY